MILRDTSVMQLYFDKNNMEIIHLDCKINHLR